MFKILSLVFLLSSHSIVFGFTVPAFTAVFDSKKKTVQIKWEHSSSVIKAYSIQRSADNNTWQDIAVQGTIENTVPRIFYFEDKSPSEGENYYRLRSTSATNQLVYSNSILIITGSSNKGWIMYPVPANDFLTLEYRGAEPLKGVINVFIQQSSGRIIHRLRSSSLIRTITIPVHNLGKGFYDIRVIVQGELVWKQRFVK